MNDPAGRIRVRIAASRVSISSTRPVHAAAVFRRRTPADTARLLPALFSVCAIAQSAACAEALEQAGARRTDGGIHAVRRRLVDAECLREHLWRVLLDWPRALGVEPQMPVMARVMAAFGAHKAAVMGPLDPFVPGAAKGQPNEVAARRSIADLREVLSGQVLGLAPEAWLSQVQDTEALARWARGTQTLAARLIEGLLAEGLAGLGAVPIHPLPELPPSELDARLAAADADRFVAEPDWAGAPAETSPLTRGLSLALIGDLQQAYGNGLLTRVAAQLAELARLASGESLAEPAARRAGLPAGVGLAQVPAARGLLVHRARIEGDRVVDYRILAPTEWNFHPRGVVCEGLGELARTLPAARIRPLANLYIAAIDPCVRCELDIEGEPDPAPRPS
jgi:hypothetical protein